MWIITLAFVAGMVAGATLLAVYTMRPNRPRHARSPITAWWDQQPPTQDVKPTRQAPNKLTDR
jgi:hypothetical protein